MFLHFPWSNARRHARLHVDANGGEAARDSCSTHSRSSPVNTAEGVFRLADDLRRERVSEGVDRIMASPVAVDRRPIRVITGWHLPGRDHNDNGRFAGRLHPTCCLHRARGAACPPLSCTVSFGRINSHPPGLPPPRFYPGRSVALRRSGYSLPSSYRGPRYITLG